VLYAAVGQQIYRRDDGAAPRWRLVYTNPDPGHSETGLRGLTAVPNPAGQGEVLLAAVEGNAGRIVRVDPASGAETSELDIRAFLAAAWGAPVGYIIAAYNDMTKVGDLVLIGAHAFIPPGAAIAPGHTVVDVGYGRVDSGGWYLVRHADGRYDLHRIALPARDDRRALVAVRAIAPSPFPGDDGALYFAGYDANKVPAHNTAWIARAGAKTALGERQ
jgi:poly(A) polymerase